MEVLEKNVVGEIGAAPRCRQCGSERVVRDAWATWSPDYGLWELEQIFDAKYCINCEAATEFVWKRVGGSPRQRVRELNDRARAGRDPSCVLVVTGGVAANGAEFVARAVAAVRDFAAFTEDNDPWGEHDFGAVTVDGQRIFWKIDCYDPTMTQAPENAGNSRLSRRVLTIMLAGEY